MVGLFLPLTKTIASKQTIPYGLGSSNMKFFLTFFLDALSTFFGA